MIIAFHSKIFIRTLWAILGVLLLFYMLAFYLPSVFQIQLPLGEQLTQTLNILEENNLPTLFSTILFLLAAASTALIAQSADAAHKNHWSFLCGLFIVCGIDESACFHERLSFYLQKSLGFQGALYYSWIIPAAVLVLVLTATYAPLVIKLASSARVKIIAAGAIFVTGAVGFEPIQGWIVSNNYYFQMEWLAITLASVEEVLELTGLILFIDGTLDHLTSSCSDLSISLSS